MRISTVASGMALQVAVMFNADDILFVGSEGLVRYRWDEESGEYIKGGKTQREIDLEVAEKEIEDFIQCNVGEEQL
jgi:hypothetical protein